MVNEAEGKSKAHMEGEVRRLTDWLTKQPHLPKDIDENFLVAFIDGTKTLEAAKKKIDSFFSARTKFPQNFEFPYRDPLNEEFRESCKFTKMFYLPQTTPEGYRIIMLTGYNADKFNNHLFNMRLLMFLELALVTWPDMAGAVIVVDGKGSDCAIVPKMSIGSNLSGSQYLQSSIPLKFKHIIIFNATPVVEVIVNKVVKPLLSKTITDRIKITTENEKMLEKYFPLKVLPRDYPGGEAPSSDELNDHGQKMLEDSREWFLKLSKLCSDESKRPPDIENTYGTEGTFRYLALD